MGRPVPDPSLSDRPRLTEFGFGDYVFLSMAQFTSTVLVLLVLQRCRRVEIPLLSRSILADVSPVALMFL